MHIFIFCLHIAKTKDKYIYYIDKSVLVEKKTTRKVHTKPHPGLEWRIFHILTSEDIDDVISRFYTAVCANILLSM